MSTEQYEKDGKFYCAGWSVLHGYYVEMTEMPYRIQDESGKWTYPKRDWQMIIKHRTAKNFFPEVLKIAPAEAWEFGLGSLGYAEYVDPSLLEEMSPEFVGMAMDVLNTFQSDIPE